MKCTWNLPVGVVAFFLKQTNSLRFTKVIIEYREINSLEKWKPGIRNYTLIFKIRSRISGFVVETDTSFSSDSKGISQQRGLTEDKQNDSTWSSSLTIKNCREGSVNTKLLQLITLISSSRIQLWLDRGSNAVLASLSLEHLIFTWGILCFCLLSG